MSKALDLEIRLQAIEYVLCEIGKVACLSAGLTPDLVDLMRRKAREKMLAETFEGADPTMSDHVSGELADRVDDLILRIQRLVAKTTSP